MISPSSPFFQLQERLCKSSGPTFDVVLNDKAHAHMKDLGPEERKRAQKIINRVHGSPISAPNPHVSRMNENQHVQVGLDPRARNGYTLGDYRIRMMGRLDGQKMTVFYVGTREDSKHTGRSRR